ncbi:MAG: VCBS repeat-containing protein [Candidatus Accumulibacter sp.]|nr:VCBS repeat-containing protein [Accumulibacter sp.]
MRITGSMLQLESSQNQFQQHEVSESMRMWTGRRPPDSSADGSNAASERVRISDAGHAAQSAESTMVDEAAGVGQEDTKLLLLRFLLARLTGKEVDVFDTGKMGGAVTGGTGSRENFGVEYDRHESYTETERMDFSASGVIQTADGKRVDFSLSMSMERSYHTESDVSIRLGNARETCDPLVINFSGNAAQLTDERFSFDLNSDGDAGERINFLGSGSGFLAFDRNGDGVINNGSELFGARTGKGFAELAALDGDGNGWIDESDDAFKHLSVWIKDSAGTDLLRSLKDMGVGAISLSNVASPFSIKDENNDSQGQIRASGIYLREDGGVGSLQQIDLTV